MIDSVANLLFRCSHRRLTRPVTPVSKAGVAHGQTYVVCLDCGKQFSYDLQEMRVGKPLESSHDEGVLHPAMPKPDHKLKYALWASVPLAFLAGAFLRNGKKSKQKAPKEPGSA
jgi:DNA-directed RNA polymerase subunit RPC12/RpoP